MSHLSRFATIAPLLLSLSSLGHSQTPGKVLQAPFGKDLQGTPVSLYTLRNASGMEVKITNYGATITTINVPDRQKKVGDVVLGFQDVSGYTAKNNTSYFGAVVGRYGNRIAHGKFTLNGHEYHLPVNDGPNTLHGGIKGFDKRVWDAKDVSSGNISALELHYLSKDGEEGFPGNLQVTVRYSLGNQNDLKIEYSASTDKPTVLNLTNHSYFNLAGAGSKSVLDHHIRIAADTFTPVDQTLIPTGVIQPVKGTPFNFLASTRIGDHIQDNNDQLKFAKGYDHNFVLNTRGDRAKPAVVVEEPNSGRVLEVFTDQPGVQFYTGNFLDGTVHGNGGTYGFRSALCLETQHFPDSPNHPDFPTTVLNPGQQFRSTTVFKFSTK
jgi:aldose 1-epimerase